MSHRDSLTADLFHHIPRPAPEVPGSMDYRTQIAFMVGEMIAAAHARDPLMDRYAIAAACSRLAGKEISKAMLDGYTSESRDAFNAPAWLIPIIETVCKSTLYTEWLASVRGGRLVLGPDALDAEIGRLEGEKEAVNDRIKELKDMRRRVR